MFKARADEGYGDPAYADLETKILRRQLLGGEGQPGYLQLLKEISPEIARLTEEQTRSQREADILDVRRLGPEALEAMRAADPFQAMLLDIMAKQAKEELALGRGPGYEDQQAIRAAQSARGFGYGPNDVYEEAMALGEAGQRRINQRRGFAQSVVNQRNAIYGDPFLQILGRPSVNTAQTNFLTQQGQSMAQDSNPNQFDPWNAYSSDLFNTNYNAKAAANIANANRRTQLIGSSIGALGSLGGGALAARSARGAGGGGGPSWSQFGWW